MAGNLPFCKGLAPVFLRFQLPGKIGATNYYILMFGFVNMKLQEILAGVQVDFCKREHGNFRRATLLLESWKFSGR